MEDRNRILRALFVSHDQCGEDACVTTQISAMTNISTKNIRSLLRPMAGYLGLVSISRKRMPDQEIQLTAKGLDKAAKLYKRTSLYQLWTFFDALFSRHENESFRAWLKEQRIRDPNLLKLDIQEDPHHQSPARAFDLVLPMYEAFQQLCNQVDPETRIWPLHKASRLGLSWELGVIHVYEANQEAIGYPDPRTGLLPFQLVQHKSEEKKRDEEVAGQKKKSKADSKTKLDLAYNLLRSAPALIGQQLLDPKTLTKFDKIGLMYETFAGVVTASSDKKMRLGSKEEPISVPLLNEPSMDSDGEEYEYSENEEEEEEENP
mgnify:CR=1 FL=1